MCVCVYHCELDSWRQLPGTDLRAHSALWRWSVWIQDITGFLCPFYILNFSLLLSTFMELIKYPHPVSGVKELKEEFKWSPALTRLSGFFYLRSERWKFCSWSPCVSRRVHSRWVKKLNFTYPVIKSYCETSHLYNILFIWTWPLWHEVVRCVGS